MPKTKEVDLVRVNFTAPKDLVERVEQFAKERLEDCSTAIRQLIQEGSQNDTGGQGGEAVPARGSDLT